MSWTPERIEEMKKLWAEGLSASQIATRLGGGLTRNAVISKIHRSGLTHRGARKPGQVNRLKQKSKKSKAPAVFFNRGHLPSTGPTEPYVEQGQPAEYVPLGKKITILTKDERGRLIANPEFTDKICKFPIGDPRSEDFTFCGHERVPGQPYCLAHCRQAFQAPQPRAKNVLARNTKKDENKTDSTELV